MSNEDKDTSSDLDEATDDSDLQTMSADDTDGSSDMDTSSGFDEATADPDVSNQYFSDNGAESILNDSKVPPTIFDVLPIDIVYCILASVPSKVLVETFILSKKWSSLWKECPHLNFKVEDFFKNGTPPFDSFEDMLTFANYFILLRDYSSVHTFRLLFDYFVEPKRFFTLSGSWIHYALNRGVEILSVPVKMEFSRGVINVIFQNNNLVELCVHFHESIFEMLPLALPSVKLPSLKRLQLVGLYLNSVLISQIITGCPLLNNLSLEDSIIDTNEISSDIIQRLYLHSSFYMAPSTVFSILNAPRTTDLTLYQEGVAIEELRIEDMPLIRTARIELHNNESNSPSHFISSSGSILNALAAVHNLHLDGPYIPHLLVREVERCRSFFSLKNLHLGGFCMFCDFEELPFLLNICPNIVCLKLNVSSFCEYHAERKDFFLLRQTSAIFDFECLNLRRLELIGSDDDDDELVLVEGLRNHCSTKLAGVEIVYV